MSDITIEDWLIMLESMFKDHYDKFPAVKLVIDGIRRQLEKLYKILDKVIEQ